MTSINSSILTTQMVVANYLQKRYIDVTAVWEPPERDRMGKRLHNDSLKASVSRLCRDERRLIDNDEIVIIVLP